jgi:hypothetical protein
MGPPRTRCAPACACLLSAILGLALSEQAQAGLDQGGQAGMGNAQANLANLVPDMNSDFRQMEKALMQLLEDLTRHHKHHHKGALANGMQQAGQNNPGQNGQVANGNGGGQGNAGQANGGQGNGAQANAGNGNANSTQTKRSALRNGMNVAQAASGQNSTNNPPQNATNPSPTGPQPQAKNKDRHQHGKMHLGLERLVKELIFLERKLDKIEDRREHHHHAKNMANPGNQVGKSNNKNQAGQNNQPVQAQNTGAAANNAGQNAQGKNQAAQVRNSAKNDNATGRPKTQLAQYKSAQNGNGAQAQQGKQAHQGGQGTHNPLANHGHAQPAQHVAMMNAMHHQTSHHVGGQMGRSHGPASGGGHRK